MPAMNSRSFKKGVFVIEGLNSFAVTFFFYYIYFFMQQKFGFGNKANLILAAAAGLLYVPASIYGGRFAQRAGSFRALKLGFSILILSFIGGWVLLDHVAAQIAFVMLAIIGMCFTWPTLEGLISEGETYEGLQQNIGVYNVVWAATGALAYFVGGALLDRCGLSSLFWVPLATVSVQLVLAFRLERLHVHAPHSAAAHAQHVESHPHPPHVTKAFMRMAWLANPCAYVAINTLVAVMPGVAEHLGLTTTMAGFCCSLWCFARMGAFVVLWQWNGWHYRFRWLLVSYLALIASFAVILVVPQLAAVIAAELAFGWAIGLIYYSSLYYSMDVGETKSEHGGIHEAAIGLGNFVGPAVGAAWLQFSSVHTNSGAGAVSALLALGFLGLLVIQRGTRRGQQEISPAKKLG